MSISVRKWLLSIAAMTGMIQFATEVRAELHVVSVTDLSATPVAPIAGSFGDFSPSAVTMDDGTVLLEWIRSDGISHESGPTRLLRRRLRNDGTDTVAIAPFTPPTQVGPLLALTVTTDGTIPLSLVAAGTAPNGTVQQQIFALVETQPPLLLLPNGSGGYPSTGEVFVDIVAPQRTLAATATGYRIEFAITSKRQDISRAASVIAIINSQFSIVSPLMPTVHAPSTAAASGGNATAAGSLFAFADSAGSQVVTEIPGPSSNQSIPVTASALAVAQSLDGNFLVPLRTSAGLECYVQNAANTPLSTPCASRSFVPDHVAATTDPIAQDTNWVVGSSDSSDEVFIASHGRDEPEIAFHTGSGGGCGKPTVSAFDARHVFIALACRGSAAEAAHVYGAVIRREDAAPDAGTDAGDDAADTSSPIDDVPTVIDASTAMYPKYRGGGCNCHISQSYDPRSHASWLLIGIAVAVVSKKRRR